MISKELDDLSRRRCLLEDRAKKDAGWDSRSLHELNNGLRQLLADVNLQIDQWQLELDAREELQVRLLETPPPTEKTRQLWWGEQMDFYAGLIDRMDQYMCFDSDARVTLSLKAQEILLLVRLMVSARMIQTDSLHPIFRYLSRYVGTEKYSRLSYESLKKRYSLWHEPTRKNVEQLLMKLLRLIDREPRQG